MTADGRDVMVTTTGESPEYVTGAYPVEQGYLVMAYQPLYEVRSDELDAALARHGHLVRALAEVGLRVVRARRRLEARERAEQHAKTTAPDLPIAIASVATAERTEEPAKASLGATA
jgi:hypothetical protein